MLSALKRSPGLVVLGISSCVFLGTMSVSWTAALLAYRDALWLARASQISAVAGGWAGIVGVGVLCSAWSAVIGGRFVQSRSLPLELGFAAALLVAALAVFLQRNEHLAFVRSFDRYTLVVQGIERPEQFDALWSLLLEQNDSDGWRLMGTDAGMELLVWPSEPEKLYRVQAMLRDAGFESNRKR
jgi:hypothetical protein